MLIVYLILALAASIVLIPVRIRVSGVLSEEGVVAAGRVVLALGALSARVTWADEVLEIRPVVVGFPVWTIRPGEKPKVKKPRPAKPAKPEKEPETEKGWRQRIDEVLEYDRRFRDPALRFLRRLRGVIRFRRLQVRGRYGGNRAETTGSLFGYLRAIDDVTSDRLQLDVVPDFQLSGFRGSLRVDLTFHLARLIVAVVRAAVVLGWGYLAMVLTRRTSEWRRSRAQAA